MNRNFFISAAVSAALALVIGGTAMAADVGTSDSGFRRPAVTFVDRNSKGTVKDVVVEAGSNPSAIELHFAGAQKVEFEGVGMLRITKTDGTIWRYRPAVYQVVDGKRRNVAVAFHFMGKDRVSLRVGKFDSSTPLVVGPVDGRNGNS